MRPNNLCNGAAAISETIVVSESGIRTPEDLRKLREHGVHIALVGEHLMKQPDPGDALHELLRPT